jgi:hypothetical protein
MKMPRISLPSISVTLLWSAIGLYALWRIASFLLSGMDYSLESELASPDGKMTIYEFQSLQDGQSHAPYGKVLSLAFRDKPRMPDDGYVFFAGYCSSPLKYEWVANDKIAVACNSPVGAKGIRTLARSMYGIGVELSNQ